MSSNAIERLIERYEEQIEELKSKVYVLEESLERSEAYADAKAYCRPRALKGQELKQLQNLPVPRLQIKLITHSEYEYEWLYALVYRHTTDGFEGEDRLTMIPMGRTVSSGGHIHDRYDSVDEMLRSLPFRDGTHIRRDAAQLNLPAYGIAEGYIHQLPVIEEVVS